MIKKIGMINISDMSIHETGKTANATEQKNSHDQDTEDKKYNFYELYVKPVSDDSSLSGIKLINSSENRKSRLDMRKDLINYVKENELTVRQAQKLFTECVYYILDETIL